MMDEKFEYSYSAPTEEERREIKNIRKSYIPEKESESKLEKLRRLDAKVKSPAMCVALTLGIVGTLIFGLGMTMVLEWNIPIWGVFVSAVGAVVAGLAYPVHKAVFNGSKNKYGEEIIKLSEELLGDRDGNSEI